MTIGEAVQFNVFGYVARQHEHDQPANNCEESQGEFITPTFKTPRKPMVPATVNTALKAIGASKWT